MRTHTLTSKSAKNLVSKILERLRSPSSKKYKGALKSPNSSSYCALGHICLAAGRTFHPFRTTEGENAYHCENEITGLPDSILQELDNPRQIENSPLIKVNGQEWPIASFNDGSGENIKPFSLSEIADAIEADWIKGEPLTNHPKVKAA